MSNNLFDPRYEKRIIPRTYYKATASNGAVALRGSWNDTRTHASIKVETQILYENQLTCASFHVSEKYAQQATNRANKYYDGKIMFECVKLERISAKEYNRLKRLERKHLKQFREKRTAIVQRVLDMNQQQLTTTGGN